MTPLPHNGRLAILVPSRGRPRTFARFVESWAMTSSGVSDILLRTGEADPLASAYEAFDEIPAIIRTHGPDTGFNSTWAGTAGYNPAQQDLYTRFPNYAAYLCIEDDCVLETPGFDAWLLRAVKGFPGRVGVIELQCLSPPDRNCFCLCLSDGWCRTLGYLCHPDLGENAFEQTIVLANMPPLMIRSGKGGAEFTHHPHLRDRGYTGDERPGALAQPDVVAAFTEQEDMMFNQWLPLHAHTEKGKLIAARRSR